MGICMSFMFLCGILVWVYLFSMEGVMGARIRLVALIVNIIILLVNLFMICKIGYDGFAKNFTVSYFFNIVLTVIGFWMFHIHIFPTVAGETTKMLGGFLEFIVFFFLSGIMAILPTVIICALMWLIMMLFGVRN